MLSLQMPERVRFKPIEINVPCAQVNANDVYQTWYLSFEQHVS